MNRKSILILFITFIFVSGLFGCSTSSPGPQGPVGSQDVGDAIVIESKGSLVSEEYDFTDFQEIEINSLMTVEISQGESYEISTEVEEDAVPHLRVSLDGKRLRIGLDPSQAYNTNNATLQAKITLPKLAHLIVDGISHVTLKDIQCTKVMDIDVKEISSLEGQINGCDLNLEVLNLSEVALEGSAKNVTVIIADLSEVDLSLLEVQNLVSEVDDSSRLISKDN